MLAAHIFMAIFGVWRLVELFMNDAVLNPVRKLAPNFYLWKCGRCVSVWAGIFATLAFWLEPRALFLLWPFAFSMLYMLISETHERLQTKRRGIFIEPLPTGQVNVDLGGFNPQFAMNVIKGYIAVKENGKVN